MTLKRLNAIREVLRRCTAHVLNLLAAPAGLAWGV